MEGLGPTGNLRSHFAVHLQDSMRYKSATVKPWLDRNGHRIWSHQRIFVAKGVMSQSFETFMGLVIVANIMSLGTIHTQFSWAPFLRSHQSSFKFSCCDLQMADTLVLDGPVDRPFLCGVNMELALTKADDDWERCWCRLLSRVQGRSLSMPNREPADLVATSVQHFVAIDLYHWMCLTGICGTWTLCAMMDLFRLKLSLFFGIHSFFLVCSFIPTVPALSCLVIIRLFHVYYRITTLCLFKRS